MNKTGSRFPFKSVPIPYKISPDFPSSRPQFLAKQGSNHLKILLFSGTLLRWSTAEQKCLLYLRKERE